MVQQRLFLGAALVQQWCSSACFLVVDALRMAMSSGAHKHRSVRLPPMRLPSLATTATAPSGEARVRVVAAAASPSGVARVRVVAAVVPQGLLLQAVVAAAGAASSRLRRGRRQAQFLLSLACQRRPSTICRVQRSSSA